MTTSPTPAHLSRDPLPRGMATALNAVRNGSLVPVTPADIERILSSGRGEPSHVHALFSDVSLATLTWLAIAFGVEQERLLAAYRTAKAEVAAANCELDALLV